MLFYYVVQVPARNELRFSWDDGKKKCVFKFSGETYWNANVWKTETDGDIRMYSKEAVFFNMIWINVA